MGDRNQIHFQGSIMCKNLLTQFQKPKLEAVPEKVKYSVTFGSELER